VLRKSVCVRIKPVYSPELHSAGPKKRDYPRITKKQDAEAISRRIHEKGVVYVFERRREHRAP
jgi:hypothetical protein